MVSGTWLITQLPKPGVMNADAELPITAPSVRKKPRVTFVSSVDPIEKVAVLAALPDQET